MYAVSGTTAAPSLPSIAQQGEWSMGQVLDVYWHFLKVGDQYLGRVLACLDPNSFEFGSLPPHWNITNPMDNKYIRAGMESMQRSKRRVLRNRRLQRKESDRNKIVLEMLLDWMAVDIS